MNNKDYKLIIDTTMQVLLKDFDSFMAIDITDETPHEYIASSITLAIIRELLSKDVDNA